MQIGADWTAGKLHDVLMDKGAGLVLETVRQLEAGGLEAQPQDESLYQNSAPKIFKEDCRIDWTQPTSVVYNFIRGLSPYPAAWTTLNGKTVKIFQVEKGDHFDSQAGEIKDTASGQVQVSTIDGSLRIQTLQIEGKRRMQTDEFLRGYKEAVEKFI